MADKKETTPDPVPDVNLDEVAARIEETQRKLAADILDLRHETQPSVVASKTARSLGEAVRSLIRTEEGAIKPEIVLGSAAIAAGIVVGLVVKIVKAVNKN